MNGAFLNLGSVQQEIVTVEACCCNGTDPIYLYIAVSLSRTFQKGTHLDNNKSNKFGLQKKNQL